MELKAETIVPQGTTISLQFYPKSETDAYIKELKDDAISMFRLREKCRGLDRESPLGQIADAAFKHWNTVELLEDRVAEASVTMAELRGLIAILKSQLKDEEERSIRQERHQKYKRCLAMAKWCEIGAQFQHNNVMQFDNPFYVKRAEWLEKWRDRWLELAEKFKPNNTTAQ